MASTTPANAMATSNRHGGAAAKVAVVLAGVLNLIGAFLSVAVAKTISSGLVDEAKITPVVIFGGLVGAILWNLLTWLLGMPSSSSHALFGGLIGATWVAAGASAIKVRLGGEQGVAAPGALAHRGGHRGAGRTYFAYRIATRGEKDHHKGFRLSRSSPRRWSRWPHGPTTRRRPWVSSRSP